MSDSPTFKEVVQKDHDVCSNCFRRTHDRYERNYRLEVVQQENDEGKLEWTVEPVNVQAVEMTLPNGETETLGGMDDRIYRRPDNTMKITEKGGLRGQRTVCKCGMRWGPEEVVEEWKERPLPKWKFFEYAQHLIERLDEAGVSFDENALKRRLGDLKSNPDEQFADDRIYTKAVAHASTVTTISSEDSEDRRIES